MAADGGERVDERPRRYVDNLHATGIGIVLDVKIAPESHHKALQHVVQVKPAVCLDNPGRLLSLFLLFIEMLDDIADIVVLVDREGTSQEWSAPARYIFPKPSCVAPIIAPIITLRGRGIPKPCLYAKCASRMSSPPPE